MDAAAGELGGDFARGLSPAAIGGLRPRMPLEATQAEALHTCRTVYSLILSCHLLALLLLAVSYLARVSGAKKPGEAQHRRREDPRRRYAQCEQSSPCAQPTLSLSSAYPQPTL